MYFRSVSEQFIFGESGTIGRVGINKESPQFPLDVDHQLNDTGSTAAYRYITISLVAQELMYIILRRSLMGVFGLQMLFTIVVIEE